MSQSSPTSYHHGETSRSLHESQPGGDAVTRPSGGPSAHPLPRRESPPRSLLSASEPRDNPRPLEAGEVQKRSFGMQSILNPSQQDVAASPVSSSTTSEGLARPVARVNSPTQASLLRQPSVTHGAPSPTVAIPSSRPIITPRSPGLRASSLGAGRGFVPATEPPPGPSSALRAVDTQFFAKSDGQPSPSTMTIRSPFNFPPMAEGRSSIPPRLPPETSSTLTSPTSAAMNISQYRTAQEAYPSSGGSQRTPFTPSFPPSFGQRDPGQAQHQQGGSMEGLPDYGAKTRQMFLDTAQGRIGIEVEVDTQAASRMADEKRRRNAGASARFRQRRKEKEREASHTINNLEGDLKSLADERDFYMNERNFFRDLASRYTQLPPRPPSPQQHHRDRIAQIEERASKRQGPFIYVEPPDRKQRRRTSVEPSPVPTSGPPALSAGPSQTLPLPPLQTGPPSNFPPFSPNRPPQLPAPPIAPAGSMPPRTLPPYDSLRPQEPYDRSWNPGR